MNLFRLKAEKLKSMYLPDLYDEAVEKNTDAILDLNREQLKIGKKADENFLRSYSETSVNYYGKPRGPIRLYETGAFWGAFFIDYGADAFEIKSSDEKNDMLVEEFTEDIFGLIKTQKSRMALIIKQDLVNNIKKYL